MELLLLALMALGIAGFAQADLRHSLEQTPPKRGYALAFIWKKGQLSEGERRALQNCCTLDEEIVPCLERAPICKILPFEHAEVVWAPVRSRAPDLEEDEVHIVLVLDPSERLVPIDLWPSVRKACGATVPLQVRFGAIGGARFL